MVQMTRQLIDERVWLSWWWRALYGSIRNLSCCQIPLNSLAPPKLSWFYDCMVHETLRFQPLVFTWVFWKLQKESLKKAKGWNFRHVLFELCGNVCWKGSQREDNMFLSCTSRVLSFLGLLFQTGWIILAFFLTLAAHSQDLSNAVWALTKLGIQNAILYNLLADRILFLGSLNRNMLRKSLGDVPPMESWMKS